jgi:hypothetical protein
MYSSEYRLRAVRLYIKLGKRVGLTIRQLGYPTTFDAHTRGFAALGGVARPGIYDNMKTAVDHVGRRKAREVNAASHARVSG